MQRVQIYATIIQNGVIYMQARLTKISKNEIAAFLGYGDTAIPEQVSTQIDACINILHRCSASLATYKIFEKQNEYLNKHILLGKDINTLLRDCDKVILFAATLGMGAEAELSRLQATDMAMAVIFDACASCAIESICDNFCEDLKNKYGYITDRFSVGYGDYPFSVQREFEKLLDMPKSIGVTMTDSGLMIPQKSVTAIIGIASSPQAGYKRGCDGCSMKDNCDYRKDCKHCDRQ